MDARSSGVWVPAPLCGFVAEAVLCAVRAELAAERERGGAPFPAGPYIALARALRAVPRGTENLAAPADLMSTAQVADALGITTRRVRRLCSLGRLPARRNELGEWLIDPEGIGNVRHARPGA